jgi:hypothetical protein
VHRLHRHLARTFLPVTTGELPTFENQQTYKLLTDKLKAALAGTKLPA